MKRQELNELLDKKENFTCYGSKVWKNTYTYMDDREIKEIDFLSVINGGWACRADFNVKTQSWKFTRIIFI